MKNKSMKRMLMTAATIAICLSLTACGQTGSSNAENSNTETIQSVEMSDANTETSNDGSEEVTDGQKTSDGEFQPGDGQTPPDKPDGEKPGDAPDGKHRLLKLT